MAYTYSEDGFNNADFDRICLKKNVDPNVYVVNNHHGVFTDVIPNKKYDVTRMFFFMNIGGIPLFSRVLMVPRYLSTVYGKIIEECDGKIIDHGECANDKIMIIYMGKHEYVNYENAYNYELEDTLRRGQ